jgi:hypothetical protein
LIDVIPADDRRTFREFLKFPFKLYDRNPLWVPPLFKDMKERFSYKNPFFNHAFVKPFIAKINGKTVGRITAIYNQAYINFSGEKAGFFGFFDCIEEDMVADALIRKARKWLGDRGMLIMRGPMNFTSNEEWGVLIEGFDTPPMIMMPYNFPYYSKLLERSGLIKAKDLLAYIADTPEVFPEKVYSVARIAEKHDIKVRPINLRSFTQEMQVFKNIYNSAWKKNWGFMPLSDDEIEYTARKLKTIIVPELTLIAEYKSEPVGLMMFLPDFNYVLKRLNGRLFPFGILKAFWYSRKVRDVRLLLLGIKEGFRKRGVDSLLFIEGLKGLKKRGYKRIEFSWVLEDNYPVQRIIETMQGKIYKRYRIYECNI